ncbi:MAG: crossover junction endodeoxyribonuclease RuvC [Myxococcota bacterium]
MAPLRILGIDPGTLCVGYGVIEASPRKGGAFAYLECGVLRPSPSLEVPERIAEIATSLTELITEFEPSCLALEKAFHGKNAASALKLGQARGAIMLLASQHGLQTSEYAPSTIKQQVVGHGRATKAQVQARVQLLFGLQTTPSTDAADALAIALCHGHSARTARPPASAP